MVSPRTLAAAGNAADFPYLPPHLRQPSRWPVAVLGGWLMALAGAVLLSFLVGQFAGGMAKPDFPLSGGLAVLALVVMAPLVETLIMGAVIELLRRFLRPGLVAVASALGWGAAHSAAAAAWGLVVWWPFLIFSALYLVWRQRGVSWAMLIAFLTHALHNLVPALMIATR